MKKLVAANWVVLALWVLSCALLLPWILDRVAPFEVVETPEPPAVKPGGTVYIVKKVRRDLGHSCSVQFQRYLVDADGAIYSYDAGYLSATNRAAMNGKAGPWVKTALEVPAKMAAGRATLFTDLSYVCNPIHALWPIRVSDHVSFEVLP